MPLSPHDENECVTFLRRSVLLKACTDDQLKNLCKQAEKKKYSKGEYLQKEGEPQKNVFVLSQGEVTREKNVNGERHQIDTYMGGNTVGSLHVMNKDPAYASTKANSEVVAYEIKSEPIVQYFKTNPEFAYNVAHGLALEVNKNHSSDDVFRSVDTLDSKEHLYWNSLQRLLPFSQFLLLQELNLSTELQ